MERIAGRGRTAVRRYRVAERTLVPPPAVAPSVTADRCGYTHHEARFPDRGACTCWRPTYEDRDRCVWHADEDAKPPTALERADPRPGERLDGAVLRGVTLAESDLLADAVLLGAELDHANLDGASLGNADLRGASLAAVRATDAEFSGANLEAASLEGAQLQGASFADALLDDAHFASARVGRDTSFDDRTVYARRLENAETDAERERQFDAATWVYRQIQSLARQNALFPLAEQYFYREKDLRRQFHWLRGNYLRAARSEGARWIMGYGRSPWRVLWTSAIVVLACALLFPFVGGLRDTVPAEPVTYSLAVPPERSAGEVLGVLGTSLYLSVVTFGTLGFGDVEPVGTAARALAAVETLVGFALVALLISVLLQRGDWL